MAKVAIDLDPTTLTVKRNLSIFHFKDNKSICGMEYCEICFAPLYVPMCICIF